MDKLTKLKDLLQLLQNDTITPTQLKEFLTLVLNTIKTSKDSFDKLSAENIQTIKDSISFIETQNSKLLKDVSQETSTSKDEMTSKMDKSIAEMKKMCDDMMLKKPMDGETPQKGTDYFTETDKKEMCDMVIKEIPPIIEETGEIIVDKINELSTIEENQIDFKHIKNVPIFKNRKNGGIIAPNLYQLGDVSITTPLQGNTLKYNATTNLWENSAGSGIIDWGSIAGTLSNQTDLQTALNAKAPSLGADDNYVTDAQLVVIGNTSGSNSGDSAVNSLYSGLAASKADVAQTMYIGTTQVAINRASAALALTGITSIDGSAATVTGAAQTAITSLGTLTALQVDNININGNIISSTDTNGNITLTPNGTGYTILNGNVGIGTTAPGLKLESYGTLGSPATSGTAQNGSLRLSQSGGTLVTDFGMGAGGGSNGWIQVTNSGNLSGAYSLLLNPNGGNVGIGTTDPAGYKLNVNGDIYASSVTSPAFYGTGFGSYGVYSANTNIKTSAGYAINFLVGTDNKVIINSDGNVGIGTTVPYGKLDVYGAEPNLNYAGLITGMDTTALAANIGAKIVLGSTYTAGGLQTGGVSIGAVKENATTGVTDYGLALGTRADAGNITEKVRITSLGNVGIGTTVPTARLMIKEGSATAGTAPLKLTQTSAVVLTTPEPGVLECNDGDALYYTIKTGSARKTIAFTTDIVSQVEDNITDGHTTVAPSGNAVFDALALKAPLTSAVLVTPNLGTPSAGVLTNATGLPAASVVAGVLGVTGTRMTKLWATDIESTNMPTVGGVSIRTKRVVTTTDDATAVIDVDVTDVYELTAVANATTFSTTGTPTDGQTMVIRFLDAGVAKGLTWDAIFVAIGCTAPTTTVAGKWHYVMCQYNTAATKWHILSAIVQA